MGGDIAATGRPQQGGEAYSQHMGACLEHVAFLVS